MLGLPGHLGAAMRACLHADREHRAADCAGLLAILNGKSPATSSGIGTSSSLGAAPDGALAAGGLATAGGGTGAEPLALAVGELARPAVVAVTAVPPEPPRARSRVAAPTWDQDEAARHLSPPDSLLLEPLEDESTARHSPPESLLLEPEEDRARVGRAAPQDARSETDALRARPAAPGPASPLAERESLPEADVRADASSPGQQEVARAGDGRPGVAGNARAKTPPPAVGSAVPRSVRGAALAVMVVIGLGVLGVGGAVLLWHGLPSPTSSLPSAGPGAVIPGALAPDASVPGATTTAPTVPAQPAVGTGQDLSGALASAPAVAPTPVSPTTTAKSGPANGGVGKTATGAASGPAASPTAPSSTSPVAVATSPVAIATPVSGPPTGSLRVSGDATKVQLVSGASIYHAGDAIPTGVYTVRAKFPAGNVIERVGMVTIRAGATTDLVFDSSFDNCHL